METKQKVAVISGASEGIGAALVKAYRDRNYKVVATARSMWSSYDDEVLVVPGDIADRKTAEHAISAGIPRFGRIDTLVNNAGIFIAKPFTQYTEAGLRGDAGRQRHRLLPHHAARHRRDAKAGAAAMSCRSPQASSTMRSPARRPCSRR
jgi:NAD(P)-dependent dehydrogenase (short-subunit alcohol dehydrogenase family)